MSLIWRWLERRQGDLGLRQHRAGLVGHLDVDDGLEPEDLDEADVAAEVVRLGEVGQHPQGTAEAEAGRVDER